MVSQSERLPMIIPIKGASSLTILPRPHDDLLLGSDGF
jgi:hypothetical protein